MEKEELIRDQKEIARVLALQQRIQEKIAQAIRKGESKVTIGYKTILTVKLLEPDPKDGNKSIDNYKIKSNTGIVSANAKMDKKTKAITVDVDFNVKAYKIYMDARRKKERDDDRNIRRGSVDGKDESVLEKQIQRGLKTGKVKELDGRRYGTGQTAGTYVKSVFGESTTNIYRVEGRDHHDFKYVVRTRSGKYKQLNATSRHEGRNPHQKIWIMKDGKLEEKRVDSLLIKGQFAIATDFPDSVISQNTKTYFGVRLPNGQYLAAEVGERSGVNRTISGNKLQRSIGARGASKFKQEAYVGYAETAKESSVLYKDKVITTEEVEFVGKLQKKGLSPKQVNDTIDTIHILKELGFKKPEVYEIVEKSIESRSIGEINEMAIKAKKDGNPKEVEKAKTGGNNPKLPGSDGERRIGYDPKHGD